MKLLLYWMIVLALVMVCREEPSGIVFDVSNNFFQAQDEVIELGNNKVVEGDHIESGTLKAEEWITYDNVK